MKIYELLLLRSTQLFLIIFNLLAVVLKRRDDDYTRQSTEYTCSCSKIELN